jgi:hypothetical protein
VCSTKAIELERRSPRGETAEVLDTLLVVAGSAAGSAQVTDGERINSVAVFFERARAVKAGLSFGWGEHAMSRTIETQTMFIRHTAIPSGNAYVRDE